MRSFLLIAIFYLIALPLVSQTAEDIIDQLNSINQSITNQPCSTGSASLISNRAMNIFLADKTGYLSERGDLSMYTNYVTINTSEGMVAVNHNFQKATGIDDPIKKLWSLGLNANIANTLAATFLDKKFENELMVAVNHKWLGKVKTHSSACSPTQNNNNQKQAMDALRASILHSLKIEILKRDSDFKAALTAIDEADVPGQNPQMAKAIMQQEFYENLKEEYTEKFARLQAETLTKTNNYNLIATGWTSLTVNIPLVFPKYTIAQSLSSTFAEKHPYPLSVQLSHTRLWESSKAGRLFFTVSGEVFLNNSKLSYSLDKTNFAAYKNLGGADTLHLARLKNDKAYIGPYETFVTPLVKGRLVYFPPTSHIGISFLLEQNFGRHNLLNGRLGVPIILINSKKLPAANFEFFISFYDMNNKTSVTKSAGNKTAVGLGVGIPFSRLMY